MSVFRPHISLGHQAIDITVQLLLKVLWTVLDLLLLLLLFLGSLHLLQDPCISLPLDFFLSLFIFFPVTNQISAPLSPHTHTHRVDRFVLTHPPVSHFHYKTEWIWATAWITSPHLHISLSCIFQKVVRGCHSFSVLLWGLQWMSRLAVWGLQRENSIGTASLQNNSFPASFSLISGRTRLTG